MLLSEEEVHFLEFGVCEGDTFAIWVRNNLNSASRFWGFDSFQGLPEDWGSWKKGSFSTQGKLPDIDDERCRFIVGLIQDTLPDEILNIKQACKKVIHIDVDLYSATLATLSYIRPLLRPGDIIIFDDFFTIVVADHEFKAFWDFLASWDISYKPLAKCRMGQFVIEIK
jgi:hypothetical protein